jgi:hypothetical protein
MTAIITAAEKTIPLTMANQLSMLSKVSELNKFFITSPLYSYAHHGD